MQGMEALFFILRVRALIAALLCGAMLAGCGGGVFIGFGDDDDPPDVGLVASSSGASAGQTVRLTAAASDDWGVDFVSFFRIDDNGNAVLLGSDGVAPFLWDATMPSSNASSVQFFARAVDGAGQSTDSAVIAVNLLP